MKNLFIVYFVFIGAIILTSCNKTIEIEDPNSWTLPPNKFLFQITQNGERLADSTLNNLKMFYVDHDRRVYEAPNELLDNRNHIILPSYMSNDGYLEEYGVRSGPYVNGFAVEHNTWYFEFPNGDIDTLYVENKILSEEEGKRDECYCINPFTVMWYNGKDAYKHPTIKASSGKPIWVLEK